MSNELAEWLGIEKDLVCEFMLCFSRFEFALKRSRFTKAVGDGVKPDWDKFANSLRGKFPEVTDADFAAAVRLLDTKPPDKQVLVNDTLEWADSVRGPGESLESWVMRMVRMVRNNLFHGGKYGTKDQPELARNASLLKACLVILDRVLGLAPDTRWQFLHG